MGVTGLQEKLSAASLFIKAEEFCSKQAFIDFLRSIVYNLPDRKWISLEVFYEYYLSESGG